MAGSGVQWIEWLVAGSTWLRVLCLALGVVLLASPSCGRQAMGDITLTKADNGKTIELRPGQMVVVELNENAMTGYRWAIDRTDEQIAAAQGADMALTPGGGVGAGGKRTFRFQAKKVGTAHLELKLWRDWEGDKSIIDRFNVTLQVHD